MRIKITILFLALLLSAPAFAQQPRIDSIAVDEDKGELVLHGNFQNSSVAIVIVDSISLKVTLASDTLIRATIPVSGKGSAGFVSITSNGNQSNNKLLTYFHFQIYFNYWHHYSDGGLELTINDDSVHVRLDLSTETSPHPLIPSQLSKFHALATGQDGIHGYKYLGPKYDSLSTINEYIYFNGKNSFSYYCTMPQTSAGGGNQSAQVYFDNEEKIIPYTLGCNNLSSECIHWDGTSPTDFSPSSAAVQGILSPNIIKAHLSSNPVFVNAAVIVTLHDAMNVRMEIMDILGHIVFSDERMLSAGENKLPINSSSLSSGIYICRLQAGGEVMSVRFVKE